MNQAVRTKPRPSKSEAAERARLKAGGDRDDAIKYLLADMRRDTDLYREVMAIYEETAARELIGDADSGARARAWGSEMKGKIASADYDRIVIMAKMSTERMDRLMDFPLPVTGKFIGDATRPEILEGADHYDRTAVVNARRGAWMRLVASRLKDDVTVPRKTLTSQDLYDLKRATSKIVVTTTTTGGTINDGEKNDGEVNATV